MDITPGRFSEQWQEEKQMEKENTRKIQIYSDPSDYISSYWKEKYERDAKKYWDIFYKRHENRFFKDRHYLDKEWGNYFMPTCSDASDVENVSAMKKIVLEVGCGVGNTVFPLLSTFPNLFVYACDFSSRAIDLVKGHNEYNKEQVHAFVCDVTADNLCKEIPPRSVDIVTLIFVLSAVSPKKMAQVLQNIKNVIKPNGYVLVRDYAVGDLAQERLLGKEQKISENFYVRGDGTRVFYFSEETLRSFFGKCDFVPENIGVHCKRVENRSRGLVMDRRWIQGAFKLKLNSPSLHFEVQYKGDDVKYKSLYADDKDLCSKVMKKESDHLETDLSESLGIEILGSVPNANEVINISIENKVFSLKCLSKEYQHTCKTTGLMLWESAQFLAPILAANSSIVTGRTVLELGCGSAGICSMVTTKASELVVATDGDESVLQLLDENIKANAHHFNSDKLVSKILEWGNKEHIDRIQSLCEEGFDVIIGTDVVYIPHTIVPLFQTAKALAHEDRGTTLILCHMIRHVNEESILSAAVENGFYLEDKWPADADDKSEKGYIASWFSQDSHKVSFIQNALRIMLFKVASF